jgi:hypothetical protein
MLNECYKYATAINTKDEPFSAEPLIMALFLLSQHKMIDWVPNKFQSINHLMMIIIEKLSVPKKKNKT